MFSNMRFAYRMFTESLELWFILNAKISHFLNSNSFQRGTKHTFAEKDIERRILKKCDTWYLSFSPHFMVLGNYLRIGAPLERLCNVFSNILHPTGRIILCYTLYRLNKSRVEKNGSKNYLCTGRKMLMERNH